MLTNPGDWSDPEMMHLYHARCMGSGEPLKVATEWQISLPSWSPDGSRFAFVSGGNSIRIWTDGIEEWIDVKGQLASHVTWSPDGSRLFVPTSSPPNPSWLVIDRREFRQHSNQCACVLTDWQEEMAL